MVGAAAPDRGGPRTRTLMARLILKRGDGAAPESSHPISSGRASFVLGRAPGCDLVVDDTAASRRHCAIERTSSGYRLVDLKSSNGTRLNGARVESADLKDGDTIQIGTAAIEFRAESSDVAEIVLDEPAAGGTAFELRIRGGESIPLPSGRHTIGRGAKNKIVLAGGGVSSVHAEIRVEGLKATLKDLGSTNGTYVNGERVEESPLAHGDTIRFGSRSAVIVDPERAAVEAADDEGDDAPLVDKVTDAEVPRRRGGLFVVLSLAIVLAGGAAAYRYLPGLLPASSERAVPPAVHSARNLVPAGAWSFEGENAGALWRERGGEDSVSQRIDETDSASGFASLKLSTPESRGDPLVVELRDVVPVSSIHRYRLTVRSHAAGGTATAVAGCLLAWFGEGTAPIAVDVSDAAAGAGEGFSDIAVEAAPPRNATGVRPALYVAGGGASQWFDDVVLEETGGGPEGVGAALSTPDAELRFGPKGDLSLARGIRSLFQDLVPAATIALPAGPDSPRRTAELDGLFFGAVRGSRTGSERAEWTLELLCAAAPLGTTQSVEAAASGFRVSYDWSLPPPGDGSVGVSLLLDPSQESAFLVVGEAGSSPFDGEFSFAAARDVIVGKVGGEPDPFRLRFSPAADVRARRDADGGLRLAAFTREGHRLEVTIQTSFVEERNRAAALRDALRRAEGARRFGEALAQAEEILRDLPFHDAAVADARRAVPGLREAGESEIRALEDRLRDVEFLPGTALAETLASAARSAAETWAGTRYAERAAEVARACDDRLAAVAARDEEERARRRGARAADLEAAGHPALAALIRRSIPSGGAEDRRETDRLEGER